MLGAVMYDLGRYDESIRLCQWVLGIRPDLHPAHYTLGLAHLAQGDFRNAAECFTSCLALRRGAPWQGDRARSLASPAEPEFSPDDMAVSRVKLAHDCEQLEHLLSLGRLPPEFRAVAADYRALLGKTAESEGDTRESFDAAQHPLVARTYKRPLHLDAGEAPAGPVLNPDADWRGAAERYLGSDPSIAIVDGLLTPQALDGLRRYCKESTLWNDIKAGYLGAYLHEGFAPEILLRLAQELRARLPGVIGQLPLHSLWAYKYDSAMQGTGIGLHADIAVVNVNFWITEDEANLDPALGGLLVHERKAPKEWSFSKYNTNWEAIVDFLESAGSVPVRVPYRANRAVIFDSDLFHASDSPRFKEGYANRRINVTLLYGQRAA
jgi:tetratricopeptide (TPR) repeat protein